MLNAVLCCIHNFITKLHTYAFEEISKVEVLKAYAITCGINTPFFMMSITIDFAKNEMNCFAKTGNVPPYPLGPVYFITIRVGNVLINY